MKRTIYPWKNIAALLCLIIVISCYSHAPSGKYKYPAAPVHNTYDTFFGTRVNDPYRWLENEQSPETVKWVNAEKKLAESFLSAVPDREKVKTRLTELFNYQRYSQAQKKGTRYFFYKNDGLQNQSVLYMHDGEPSKARILIDPNTFSKDGTVALSNLEISKDGNLLVYGISEGGSDREILKIRDITTGKDYDDTIKWCKFTSIAWKSDNAGFYYNRYPEPGTVPVEDENSFNRVYYHALGTPQSKDVLIYERPDHKEWSFGPIISDDGKYLILYVWYGTDPKNRIYYRASDSDQPFITLLDKADALYGFVGNAGTVFYFHTDLNTPKGSLIAIDTNDPEPAKWKVVIPEQNDVVESIHIINQKFVVSYLHDVWNQVKIYNPDGSFDKEIKVPPYGSVSSMSGETEQTEMFFSYSSFLSPSTVYRYNFISNELIPYLVPNLKFDLFPYETKQIFYTSKDGTRVPMFITHRKGIALDGTNPAWLYGYGGFNASLSPYFSTRRLVWLERGGVLAIANLRGGNEYGEQWHQAGMLDNKQNVFDDFIAAAQWLINNKYTRPSKLVIEGESNGGLLVAAAMLQRPDLFGAVICGVPVTDMLRYHKFTVGSYWAPEFGNAEKSEQEFKVLYAYSPLHNVKKGTSYPPIMVMTAEGDDRVVPAHAMKFVATLQAASQNNLVLMRVESKAGHGHGKPVTKIIDEEADIYAFVMGSRL